MTVLNELFDRDVVEVSDVGDPDKLFFKFDGDTVNSFISKCTLMQKCKDKAYEMGYSIETRKYTNPIKVNGKNDFWAIRILPRSVFDSVEMKPIGKPLFYEKFFDSEYDGVSAAIEFLFDRITYDG